MRTTSKLLAVALAATLQSAMAAEVTLDFENVTSMELLNGTYGGVTVSKSAFGVTSSAPPCQGDDLFKRDGSCGALWIAADTENTLAGNSTVRFAINEGFIDAVSFFYSGKDTITNLAVRVFGDEGELGDGITSGLDGGGCANTGFPWCNWNQVTYKFTGVARYVEFSAKDAQVLLDDVKFINQTASNQTPEPASAALALSALGALGIARRRRSAR